VRIDDGRENYERRGWNLIYISRARASPGKGDPSPLSLSVPLFPRLSDGSSQPASGQSEEKKRNGVRVSWKAAMMSETMRLDAWISFARVLPARGNARQHARLALSLADFRPTSPVEIAALRSGRSPGQAGQAGA